VHNSHSPLSLCARTLLSAGWGRKCISLPTHGYAVPEKNENKSVSQTLSFMQIKYFGSNMLFFPRNYRHVIECDTTHKTVRPHFGRGYLSVNLKKKDREMRRLYPILNHSLEMKSNKHENHEW
jgi:hypothetical protein